MAFESWKSEDLEEFVEYGLARGYGVGSVIALEGVPRYDYDEVVSTIVQVFLHGVLRVGARSGSNAAPKRPRRARPERVEGTAPSSRG